MGYQEWVPLQHRYLLARTCQSLFSLGGFLQPLCVRSRHVCSGAELFVTGLVCSEANFWMLEFCLVVGLRPLIRQEEEIKQMISVAVMGQVEVLKT